MTALGWLVLLGALLVCMALALAPQYRNRPECRPEPAPETKHDPTDHA